MSQPVWITPAGPLGVIPENIFYRQTLSVDSDPLFEITCTATSAATNRITCVSTAGMYTDLNIMFTGNVFGGVSDQVRYFVLDVVSATEFTITQTEFSTTPVELTTATGNMTGIVKQHIYYRLISGTLPPGIQCSDNGLITGVPKAVVNLQGVPLPVNRNVTSKFVIRAYTQNLVSNVLVLDRIRDRTFELTVTGNNVPVFIAPQGSFASNNTATFTGAINGTQLIVSEIQTGTVQNGMVIRGTNIVPGTTIVGTGTADGGIGTYTVNISQQNAGAAITGWVGVYYDGDLVDLQFGYTNTDPNETVIIRLAAGAFPAGLTLSPTGRLYGYIEPFADVESPVGYDENPLDVPPYDFLTSVISTSYQFTLEVTDGKFGTLRQFSIFVYNRQDLTADTTTITSDNTFVTADENTQRAPFLLNAYPSSLGIVRSDNYFAYQFRGDDYDTVGITYAISVNEGVGLPPGLTLDPESGWYYGFIPDQGLTEITYSFSIQVSQTDNPSVASQQYPFTLTITGVTDSEVSWITPSDLGTIENGSTSILNVEAVNRGGATLKYRLASGEYNQLPQGLTLLPTGEIAGRTTFNTFAVDLGFTTFDATQSNTTGISETNFDTEFTFTVNAYAEDTGQLLYNVASVEVTDGGSGYSSINQPTLEFSSPAGSTAVTATGNAVVTGSAITAVTLTEQGAGYTSAPTITITQGFGGSGAVLTPVMQATGQRDAISVFKTFTVKVYRAYNYPYQNLFCLAMPPANDRLLINELLDNNEIFVPSYIYRPDDANFGKSTQVKYEHAYGLAPDTLDQYVSSLYENHYWKNLVLGEINTAQALDAAGNVIYEVVYSQIIDNLVNDAGQSVAKIVNLPYAITDPADGSTELTQVYPNSLINMRDQVIDVVGQISTKLPLWMTSKQTNGRVLGFTPSWVICYTNPGRSAQIAYYIQQYFAQQLNFVDFKVDRYVLDRTLSKNWDTETQHWTPQGSLTTFDFYNTAGYINLGEVECATNLAYVDINFRTQDQINALGGVDGPTWIKIEGQSPPEGTRVVLANGDKIIFVQQENYANYSVTNAWQQYTQRFDDPASYDETGTLYDEAYTIPGGYTVECTATTGGTDRITCADTTGMTAGDMIWFTGEMFGDIVSFSNNNQVYYILQVVNGTQFTITDTLDGTTAVDLSTDTGAITAVWGNYRMNIYEVTVNIGATVDDPRYITLSPAQQVAPNDYVTVTQGAYYNTAQLYRPNAPGPGFTLISWLPLITSVTVVGDQTTFDQDSMQFIAPVDMYTTSDALDKYLVFPKANILV